MAQNVYDNPEFFAGYSRLPRQLRGLDGAPEWPAIKSMLPGLTGKRVADLGCGFGWASRWMREQGAARVLGIDLSQNMIARAIADTKDTAIEYQIADIETLDLPVETFDLIYSALTFHYVCDFERLADMLRNALVLGGCLVFSIEHPIFMAGNRPQWMRDAHGQKCWPVNGYAIEGERRTDWFVENVVKYHRTLGTTLNVLIGSGFELRQVFEFAPTHEQVETAPDLAEELERPMFLLVSAHRRS